MEIAAKYPCIKTGTELRYYPSKITAEAKQLLQEFVKERGVINRSLGVTMEWAYRDMKGQNLPPICNVMSEECRQWCQAEFRDPQLAISRYREGVHKGVNHSWGSIFTCGPISYMKSDPIDIIATIPTY